MDAKTLNKLRFHLARIVQGNAASSEDDWSKLAALVTEALAHPTTSAGVELRRMLAEQAERIPSRRLVDNVYAFQTELERVAKSGAHRPEKSDGPLSATEQVAQLLRGRTMLVVGGDPRIEHVERLRGAFELREVLWPLTSKTNPSVQGLEPYVSRRDVALVLLLIRFIRHGVNWELPDVCARHTKPLVRIPAGYGVEQVAPLILEQAGKRLGGVAP